MNIFYLLLKYYLLYINTISPNTYSKTMELVWPRLLVPYLVSIKIELSSQLLLIVLLRLLCWSSMK